MITSASTGKIEGRQAFAAYGELIAGPSYTNGYRPLTGYTGHIQTDATGLIYMRGRFYSPAWHRFLNSDHGADPNQAHQFAYAHGSPLQLTDPSGMDVPEEDTPHSARDTGDSIVDEQEHERRVREQPQGKSQAEINNELDRQTKVITNPSKEIRDQYMPSPAAEADMKKAYREAGSGEISGKLDSSGSSVRDSKSGDQSTTVTVLGTDQGTWHTHPPGTGHLPSTSLNNVKGDPLLGDTVSARSVNKPFYVVGTAPIGSAGVLRGYLSVFVPASNTTYVLKSWVQPK